MEKKQVNLTEADVKSKVFSSSFSGREKWKLVAMQETWKRE